MPLMQLAVVADSLGAPKHFHGALWEEIF